MSNVTELVEGLDSIVDHMRAIMFVGVIEDGSSWY